MLITHPASATDPFTLYIKAAVLLGKVKSFNGRFRYRYTDGLAFGLGAAKDGESNLVNELTTIDPRATAEFRTLDNLIETFTAGIPKEFRDPVGLQSGAKLDPILYVAHMVPHMYVRAFSIGALFLLSCLFLFDRAMIALHDPHANTFALNDPSSMRILHAARAILDLIYKVCSTTYDLLYLDHMSSTAWFVAGVTLIRFLNARTFQGDEAEVQTLTQELDAVRYDL